MSESSLKTTDRLHVSIDERSTSKAVDNKNSQYPNQSIQPPQENATISPYNSYIFTQLVTGRDMRTDELSILGNVNQLCLGHHY